MRVVAPIIIVVMSGLVVALSIYAPGILAENSFLKGFINHELLNTMAVIVTITIATIATIHLWFNELEDKHDKKVFGRARREINSGAFWLIGLFAGSVLLLIVRAYFGGNLLEISLFNGFAIIILMTTILVLIDIMSVVRSLTPND